MGEGLSHRSEIDVTSVEAEISTIDLSDKFRDFKIENSPNGWEDWENLLSANRRAPELTITADLTEVSDDRFVGLARYLKAFTEQSRREKVRRATIRCSERQKALEYNVFGSGVGWEQGDEQ